LDWRAKVELFEQIRREYQFGIGTIAGVTKKLRMHRRMVREAIGSALPKKRKKLERRQQLPMTAAQFGSLAERAIREKQTQVGSGSIAGRRN
jgi:hypothetical protein